MTQLLKKEKSWGGKEIEARQRWLALIADQVWSVRSAVNNGAIDVPEYPFVDQEDEVAQIRLMIADQESGRVEFKETARQNTFTKRKDFEIEKAVGKTICAFANSFDGGTLLIGVDRNGAITGIERDFQFTKDRDGFGLWLSTFVRERIEPVLATKLAVSFVEMEGKTVCRVDVPPVAAPVFFDEGNTKRFYVRVHAQTNEYSGNDLLNYKNERWPQAP